MSDKRKIEVFTAGCPVCDNAISLVNCLVCPNCEVTSLDMKTSGAADRESGHSVFAPSLLW
ncbi:MAG: hypothetical protein VB778_00080 [Nitrospinaceae bacterium]